MPAQKAAVEHFQCEDGKVGLTVVCEDTFGNEHIITHRFWTNQKCVPFLSLRLSSPFLPCLRIQFAASAHLGRGAMARLADYRETIDRTLYALCHCRHLHSTLAEHCY